MITKDIVIKVKKDDVKLNTKPYVFKGDKGMVFQLTIQNWNYYFSQEPSSEVDILDGCTALIEIVLPNGELTKSIDVPIIDNEINFKINQNLSHLVGEYQIYVEIFKGKTVIATLPPFVYEVKDKPDFTRILPSDVGILRAEEENLLCYGTIDDYGLKTVAQLPKIEVEKDEDEILIEADGITNTIKVGKFLQSTRETAKNYTDETATNIRNEISKLDTEHKNLVNTTKTELTELINSKDTSQTEALNLAKTELNQEIITKHTEAKQYTDTEITKAKQYSDSNLNISKEYTNTKTTETLDNAKKYSDDKLIESKEYSNQKLTEANLHSDNNLNTAKSYTDTKIEETKVELKSYSDTNLETSKIYTNGEIAKVNGNATTNLEEAKKYTDDKLVEGKAYSDQKIKDLVGLAPEELNTIEELANAYKSNKDVLDATGVELAKKSDKEHTHDIATDLANGFMSKEDFLKLKNIEENANHYTHPKTHSANIIVQDTTHRFVTDEEKNEWTNLKLDNVSIEGQEIVFKSKNVEKFRLPLPKGFSGDYNDLTNKPSPYVLPMASDTVLGGIKLGIGLEIQKDGTVNAVSGGKADSVEWSGVLNKPTEFNPISHTHTKSEITDMFTVENVLTSDSTINSLSAKQGKVLNEKLTSLVNNENTWNGLNTFKNLKLEKSDEVIRIQPQVANNACYMSFYRDKSNRSCYFGHESTTNSDIVLSNDSNDSNIILKTKGNGKVKIGNKEISTFSGNYNDLTNKPRTVIVENNLISNSEENALSVQQGKVIDDKLNTLRNEYNTTKQNVETLNTDISPLKEKAHTHNNKEELDKITIGKVAEWNNKANGSHTHTVSELTDMFVVEDNLTSTSTTNALSSAQGKILNDKIINLETGVSNVHTHNNKATLDKISEEKIQDWDNKETVIGSQEKSNKALQDSKAYVDEQIQREVAGFGRTTYKCTVNQWDSFENKYKSTINHNLNSEDIMIEFKETTTKESAIIPFKIINNNTLEVFNDTTDSIDVLIVAGELRKVHQSIGAEIDDVNVSTTTTYSSKRIDEQIQREVAGFGYGTYKIQYNELNDSLDFVYTPKQQ